ncbi:tRNA (adenosine(37)-N6)-threonylcarbamoyltransferase complex dimerization subunit type 1 TsaB [Brachyspira catarrhinii]|uniref:tRNA (Adenosine(37)-N6)-threonylcarbamoyltransferase complex dimerization subunit type 1 TsaB n=1 Tax=Brachyspira catarrhinii TaxID=2528966 RepID=A0ABY2TSS5_9SPIR|nr:tRNA (adenosine(37)-N6)-threonylcarbamoyltransferase complex dimerization subunit type 1 TsaB [Brachyspira catarrhinii]TKZ34415.1 tRNA (adenosine(37)-N6)-threonylcarbamoyltransferase complex dimerization subunit type 1 TsaB [Brachyspira catarrhinii]
MNILAFDTVSSSFSIALKSDDSIIEINKENIKNHNSELIPILDDFLKENKLSLDNIDCIVLGIGPGSFTSIRIAFATIKSICYAKNIKIIGVSSLESLYQNIKSFDGVKLALIEARKGSVYANIYKDDKKIKENLDLTYNEIINLIDSISNKNEIITLCGDGFSKNKEFFLESLKNNSKNYKINNLDNSFNIIKASNSILLSESRFKAGDFDDIFSLSPLYLRKSEAENKKANLNNEF